jgi:hypothetical protein
MNTLSEIVDAAVSNVTVMEYVKGSSVNESTFFVGYEIELLAMAATTAEEYDSV